MSDYSALMRGYDALKAAHDQLKAAHDAALAKIAELEKTVTLKSALKAK